MKNEELENHFKLFRNPSLFTLNYSLKNSGFLLSDFLAPRTGLEPVAYRLTAGCSTIELSRQLSK